MESSTSFIAQNIASGVFALMMVATVWVLVSPLLEGDKLKKRMSSVAEARDSMKQARFAELNADATLRRDDKGLAKRLVENLSLERLLAAPDLKDKMARAGLRGQRPIYLFYFFRMALPVGLGLLGVLLFVVLGVGDYTLSKALAFTMGMTTLGYYIPPLVVKNMAGKRLNSIMPVFPDALDLLLICVESGMSVEMAFAKVSSEMAENSIELAEEFSLTTAELSYLSSRRQAYENLARRNQHEGIKSVSTALVQAERYGTPLGNTLRTMANENRQMRMLQAEKKAASLPAKLTVPMILCFLPVLFIVVLTPAGMRIMTAF